MLHVPYRGEAPGLTDLASGHVEVMFATMSGSLQFVRGGQLRALAITSRGRSQAAPDVPPLNEFVPGYELLTRVGIGAPRNTPADIIKRLTSEINAALATSTFQAKYADLGVTVHAVSPSEFGGRLAEDVEKWAKVVKFAGIKPI